MPLLELRDDHQGLPGRPRPRRRVLRRSRRARSTPSAARTARARARSSRCSAASTLRAPTAARSCSTGRPCASRACATPRTTASRSSPRSWPSCPSSPWPRTCASAASRVRARPHPLGRACATKRGAALALRGPRRRSRRAPVQGAGHRPAADGRDRQGAGQEGARSWSSTSRRPPSPRPTPQRLHAASSRELRARGVSPASTSAIAWRRSSQIADRITVLRDGRSVGTAPRRGADHGPGDRADGRAAR